jgi:hypothetical protein
MDTQRFTSSKYIDNPEIFNYKNNKVNEGLKALDIIKTGGNPTPKPSVLDSAKDMASNYFNQGVKIPKFTESGQTDYLPRLGNALGSMFVEDTLNSVSNINKGASMLGEGKLSEGAGTLLTGALDLPLPTKALGLVGKGIKGVNFLSKLDNPIAKEIVGGAVQGGAYGLGMGLQEYGQNPEKGVLETVGQQTLMGAGMGGLTGGAFGMSRAPYDPKKGLLGDQFGTGFQKAKAEGKTFIDLDGREKYEISDLDSEVNVTNKWYKKNPWNTETRVFTLNDNELNKNLLSVIEGKARIGNQIYFDANSFPTRKKVDNYITELKNFSGEEFARIEDFPKANEAKKYFEKFPKLGDVINHQEFFKEYPDMKDIRVILNSGDIDNMGTYIAEDLPGGPFILINVPSFIMMKDNEAFRNTVLHETQHAIDISKNYNFKSPQLSKKYFNDRYEQNPEFKSLVDETVAKINKIGDLENLEKRYRNKMLITSDNKEVLSLATEQSKLYDEIKKLREEVESLQPQFNSLFTDPNKGFNFPVDNKQAWLHNESQNGDEGYSKDRLFRALTIEQYPIDFRGYLSGRGMEMYTREIVEANARAVEARSFMTPKEREQVPFQETRRKGATMRAPILRDEDLKY